MYAYQQLHRTHRIIKVLLVLQSGKHLIASTIDTSHNTINGY